MRHARTPGERRPGRPKHLQQVTSCEWRFAWSSRKCPNPPNESGFCVEHDQKCSCGEQALGECNSAGSLVCGAPTCDGNLCHRHR